MLLVARVQTTAQQERGAALLERANCNWSVCQFTSTRGSRLDGAHHEVVLADGVPGVCVEHQVGAALKAFRLHDGLRVGDARQPQLELLRSSAMVLIKLCLCI